MKTDGPWTISPGTLFEGRGKTQKARVSQAARLAVEPQIMDFKARNSVTAGFDADHCGEGFAELFKRFLAGLEPELVEDKFHVDHLVLEAELREFRRRNETQHLLTPEAHTKITRYGEHMHKLISKCYPHS